MAVKRKKGASKLFTEEAKHVGRGSPVQVSRVRQEAQGMLAREHMRSQAIWTREYVSGQDKLARGLVITQDTLAREHVSRKGT